VRKLLALTVLLALGLLAPAAADAAIPNVFGTVTCTTVATPAAQAGQRQCGAASNTTTPTWDGMPIDVSVAFPPAATAPGGVDGSWPVVGIFHGWGGSKITPGSATAQRWLALGYAVFSITDRGWGSSCGGANLGFEKTGTCKKGYIRLMHNAYEVRDVQYLLGKLADQGVIDPQRIGATGGSYGGGMSLQLGALKDRVQLPDGSLIRWQSPNGTPMAIAATAPEFPWSDLAQALMPNGSSLDYVADSPYAGVNGDHRFGIQKQNWNGTLFTAAQLLGYLAPTSGTGYPDVTANLSAWNTFNSSGGPYDGAALATQELTELANHGAYYTDLSQPPAPALLSSGWNDDLFPVDETVRYYNKVRSRFPSAPIKMFDLDFGHNPRAATIAAADASRLGAAENEWFAKYVMGTGPTPTAATGGVDILTSKCSGTATTAGDQFTADDWASLAPGEVRLQDDAAKQILAPGTAPTTAFTSGNVCTRQAAGDNASAATYKLPAATGSGFTIAGSPTIIAAFDTVGANDMVAARLYSVAPDGTQQLISRGLYRPLAVGQGPTRQVWQLHPQAIKIPAGNVVKLELLTQDSPYARLTPASGAGVRNTVGVSGLELRLPTAEGPGAADGMVQIPKAKELPAGYTLARDVQTTVPGAPHLTSGDNPNATGVFGLGWTASDAATALRYGLQHRDSDDAGFATVDNDLTSNAYTFTEGSPEGEGTWTYRVNAHEEDGDPTTAASDASAPIKVDKTAPAAPSVAADRDPDYAGDGGWYKDSVTVTVTDNGDPALQDGSDGSGVDVGSIPAPHTYDTSGAHETTATVTDSVGNASEAVSKTVDVDATDPSIAFTTCPASVLLHATAATTFAASDAQSGLASAASGTTTIDTSTVGPKTITKTAADNVGHTTTASCTTDVRYMYSGIQQPINSDGSSVFKLGSTIPVKFALTDAASTATGTAVARLEYAKTSDSVAGDYLEAVSTAAATTGNLFRYDATSKQYIFNLSTKGLTVGSYRLHVVLDDGTTYAVDVSLR
jgi:hypothetical protein